MADEDKPSVYLETSFVSYISNRLSSDLVVAGQQKVSQDWWARRRDHYHLYASASVVAEASQGNEEERVKRQQILDELTILEVTEEVFKLAAKYVEKQIIPVKKYEDALHMAVAVLNGMDYLVSWNCKHLVNPVIERRIRKLNDSLDLATPYICTVLGLTEDD